MKEIKLKHCPFCGNKKVKKFTAQFQKTQMFICPDCGANVCFYGAEHEPKATQAWNRRVENDRFERI